MRSTRVFIAAIAAAALFAAACGGNNDNESSSRSSRNQRVTTTTTTRVTTTTVEEPEVVLGESQESPVEVSDEVLEPNMRGAMGGPEDSLEYSTAPEAYWADDDCHYYQQNGQWYGDLCIASMTDAYGQAVPYLYAYFQYDTNYANNLGPRLMDLYTGYPGWAMYRDWTDPNTPSMAQWILHPDPAQYEVTADNFWIYLNGSVGVGWFSVAQINAAVAAATSGSGSGSTGGTPQGLPAWDPAFLPINNLALQTIYDIQANTNPGIF